jgi:hypothetical protein
MTTLTDEDVERPRHRSNSGGSIVQDGGFNKFTWMLLAAFGTVLLILGSTGLTKLWSMSERQIEQGGDIKVVRANQEYQSRDFSELRDQVKVLTSDVNEIKRRQAEARNGR